MKQGIFPPRIEKHARYALDKHKDAFDLPLELIGKKDLIVDVPGLYAESLIAAAAVGLRYCDNAGLTLGYFSATRYMRMVTSDAATAGFESFDEMLETSEVMVVSEISHVPAKVATMLDAYLYQRWCNDLRTVVCGYNIPPKMSAHEAETIDGFSGYPLLSSRMHRTVLLWEPTFFTKTGAK